MIGGESERRDIQARLMRRLACAGGALPVADALSELPSGGEAIEGGLADLERAGLVGLGPDGIVRVGARGSLLIAADVARHRSKGFLGNPLEIEAAVASTNDLVLERAVAGAAPGLVVAAELQTSGRGRRGRFFDSAPGLGLWFSVLLEEPVDAASAPRVALVAGLAVAEAIEAETGASPRLKWPNDVRISGRKVCGILVEARTVGRRIFPVAGIGVNVHHRSDEFPPDLREVAGSVESTTGVRPDRARLLGRILDRLEVRMADDAAGGLDLPALFAPRDDLEGREIEVHEGDAVTRGTACGLDGTGRLRVRLADGEMVALHGGEASLRPVNQE